jgi:hypothetical protein
MKKSSLEIDDKSHLLLDPLVPLVEGDCLAEQFCIVGTHIDMEELLFVDLELHTLSHQKIVSVVEVRPQGLLLEVHHPTVLQPRLIKDLFNYRLLPLYALLPFLALG